MAKRNITITRIITVITTIGIHNGANTHNQDQLITPTNFRTINAIVNSPKNPQPLFVLNIFLFFLIIYL